MSVSSESGLLFRFPDIDPNIKMCVYAIENEVTGQSYIGVAKILINGIRQHFYNIRAGKHKNPYLTQAVKECGEGSFIIRVLCRDIESIELLNTLSGVYSELYKSTEREFGYNVSGKGLRRKVATETKVKARESWTTDMRKDMAKGAFDRYHSGSSRIKGRVNTPEQLAKISASMKGRYNGYKNPAARGIIAYNTQNQRQYYFRTVKEAAENLSVGLATVYTILKGTGRSYTGYSFKLV